MTNATWTRITDGRLVPVVVIDDAADAPALGQALIAGGLPSAEITFRTEAASAAIAALAELPDVTVGAGTVLTPQQVDVAVDAGAQYVVSPGLSRAVVERCQERGVLALPGAVTATEIQAALELGLKAVKFFPAATSGGAAAIKALSAPFPALSFVPTGGISAHNLADYLAVPAVKAIGGSWMVPRKLIQQQDTVEITRLVREAVQLTREIDAEAN
ncbi:MAG TPA: bifunctional 4-hydroxy-2-oxoglutarate aldolase/2-dehydro-3-deoxy-phosphogluconate aldolase [Actinomycetales bacterium]|nr:bifunctional 4-hydroxy-2-oxoglutarate aldolase/2-dehydro-3-deoxy-phosphogluconate aldolase [Actinomycetales bacterium]